jgi:hypothetical protein
MYEFFQNFQKSTKAKEHHGLVERIDNLIKLLTKDSVQSEEQYQLENNHSHQ